MSGAGRRGPAKGMGERERDDGVSHPFAASSSRSGKVSHGGSSGGDGGSSSRSARHGADARRGDRKYESEEVKDVDVKAAIHAYKAEEAKLDQELKKAKDKVELYRPCRQVLSNNKDNSSFSEREIKNILKNGKELLSLMEEKERSLLSSLEEIERDFKGVGTVNIRENVEKIQKAINGILKKTQDPFNKAQKDVAKVHERIERNKKERREKVRTETERVRQEKESKRVKENHQAVGIVKEREYNPDLKDGYEILQDRVSKSTISIDELRSEVGTVCRGDGDYFDRTDEAKACANVFTEICRDRGYHFPPSKPCPDPRCLSFITVDVNTDHGVEKRCYVAVSGTTKEAWDQVREMVDYLNQFDPNYRWFTTIDSDLRLNAIPPPTPGQQAVAELTYDKLNQLLVEGRKKHKPDAKIPSDVKNDKNCAEKSCILTLLKLFAIYGKNIKITGGVNNIGSRSKKENKGREPYQGCCKNCRPNRSIFLQLLGHVQVIGSEQHLRGIPSPIHPEREKIDSQVRMEEHKDSKVASSASTASSSSSEDDSFKAVFQKALKTKSREFKLSSEETLGLENVYNNDPEKSLDRMKIILDKIEDIRGFLGMVSSFPALAKSILDTVFPPTAAIPSEMGAGSSSSSVSRSAAVAAIRASPAFAASDDTASTMARRQEGLAATPASPLPSEGSSSSMTSSSVGSLSLIAGYGSDSDDEVSAKNLINPSSSGSSSNSSGDAKTKQGELKGAGASSSPFVEPPKGALTKAGIFGGKDVSPQSGPELARVPGAVTPQEIDFVESEKDDPMRMGVVSTIKKEQKQQKNNKRERESSSNVVAPGAGGGGGGGGGGDGAHANKKHRP